MSNMLSSLETFSRIFPQSQKFQPAKFRSFSLKIETNNFRLLEKYKV